MDERVNGKETAVQLLYSGKSLDGVDSEVAFVLCDDLGCDQDTLNKLVKEVSRLTNRIRNHPGFVILNEPTQQLTYHGQRSDKHPVGQDWVIDGSASIRTVRGNLVFSGGKLRTNENPLLSARTLHELKHRLQKFIWRLRIEVIKVNFKALTELAARPA